MIDAGTVQELFRYNRWANTRVFEAVAGAWGSYASTREALTHIVWGEWLYLERWNGKSPQTVFQAAEFPHLDTLKTRWLEVEAVQRAFVDAVSAEQLQSIVQYVNLQGESWQYPLWRQMYHVVNHSSYHRGQIALLLQQSGARPVATDFFVFHDEVDAGGGIMHPTSGGGR